MKLPPPLEGYIGWSVLEKLVQGRVFESYYDISVAGDTKNILPRVSSTTMDKSLSEWIGSLTKLEIEKVKNSWLSDIRGYAPE